jgi:hypothetical protein
MSWEKKKKLTNRDDDTVFAPVGMQMTFPNFEKVAVKSNPEQDSSVVFNVASDEEILKITKDGFYVRGVKVTQDDSEAETVYNAFKEFLTYHALTRSYR